MPLSIKDPEAERLARELARETGETITAATRKALEERLLRVAGRRHRRSRVEEVMEISRRCAALPVLDPRTPEELLDYDEHGLPR
jgi:antitoxin VapB